MVNRDFITVVSGLPRSGTSLMMQMLAAGGVPPLADGLRVADESNPRGYFEFEPVMRLRADRSWLPLARGKAVKVIHLLLSELPADGAQEYRVLLMQRPIAEVLASQRKMLARSGRTGAAISDEQLARIYESQLQQAERWLASSPAFQVLPINYHALVADPEKLARAIAEFLGGELEIQAMAAAVDPALHRERSDDREL
ncbi:MAG: sulfotransferase [Verrucomicrobiota bacterium]